MKFVPGSSVDRVQSFLGRHRKAWVVMAAVVAVLFVIGVVHGPRAPAGHGPGTFRLVADGRPVDCVTVTPAGYEPGIMQRGHGLVLQYRTGTAVVRDPASWPVVVWWIGHSGSVLGQAVLRPDGHYASAPRGTVQAALLPAALTPEWSAIQMALGPTCRPR